tara:strand:- start:1146 stop:2102 length:957 start_codon:yes stop_codon:yes gene_type:complete
MLILEDLSAEVPDTNAHHFKLKDYSQDDGQSLLAYGYNATTNKEIIEKYSHYKNKALFNNWAPCEFSQSEPQPGLSALDYEKGYNIVYSICPYTNKWLNSKNLGREYRTIFYPFSKALIPNTSAKEYDVIYHGGIHGQEHVDCLSTMLGFNYRYCTMTHHINQLTGMCVPYATNVNLQFQEKINLIAKTKISICYNLVHLSPEHIPAIKSYEGWKENEAFQEVDGQNVKPQFKTRMHEAAISKSLNLVYRDRWNIAEDYYEPDKEFIYFDNPLDLRNKIRDISNDWENYSEIVDNAYQKSMNYTVERFVNHIREDIKK